MLDNRPVSLLLGRVSRRPEWKVPEMVSSFSDLSPFIFVKSRSSNLSFSASAHVVYFGWISANFGFRPVKKGCTRKLEPQQPISGTLILKWVFPIIEGEKVVVLTISKLNNLDISRKYANFGHEANRHQQLDLVCEFQKTAAIENRVR